MCKIDKMGKGLFIKTIPTFNQEQLWQMENSHSLAFWAHVSETFSSFVPYNAEKPISADERACCLAAHLINLTCRQSFPTTITLIAAGVCFLQTVSHIWWSLIQISAGWINDQTWSLMCWDLLEIWEWPDAPAAAALLSTLADSARVFFNELSQPRTMVL